MSENEAIIVVGGGRLGRAVAETLGERVRLVPHHATIPRGHAYWLTVPDGAIVAIAAQLPKEALVLHSAGSLGPEVLLPCRGAVLHPLMTFPSPPGSHVPATVEGHADAVALATELAAALRWSLIGGVSDRVRYHAAASLVSGHLAALFCDAAALFSAATGLSLSEARATLEPLAAASLSRAAAHGPPAITGPAARGDTTTIAAHRAALPPELLAEYDALSSRIEKLRAR